MSSDQTDSLPTVTTPNDLFDSGASQALTVRNASTDLHAQEEVVRAPDSTIQDVDPSTANEASPVAPLRFELREPSFLRQRVAVNTPDFMPLRLIDITTQASPALISKPAHSSYACISHVWGEKTTELLIPEHADIVRGVGWPCNVVSVDKYTTMLTLARKYSEKIWLDLACINQMMDSDKCAQIKVMGDIYKHCHLCLVYVEDLHEETEAALNDLKSVFENVDKNTEYIESVKCWQKIFGENPTIVRSIASSIAVASLASRCEWMRRVWTLQEALLPNKVIIITPQGSEFTLGQFLGPALSLNAVIQGMGVTGMDTKHPDTYFGCVKMTDRLFVSLKSAKDLATCVLLASVPQGHKFVTKLVLKSLIARNCFKEHDRLYGLLGVMKLDIEPDYTLPVSWIWGKINEIFVINGDASLFGGFQPVEAPNYSWASVPALGMESMQACEYPWNILLTDKNHAVVAFSVLERKLIIHEFDVDLGFNPGELMFSHDFKSGLSTLLYSALSAEVLGIKVTMDELKQASKFVFELFYQATIRSVDQLVTISPEGLEGFGELDSSSLNVSNVLRKAILSSRCWVNRCTGVLSHNNVIVGWVQLRSKIADIAPKFLPVCRDDAKDSPFENETTEASSPVKKSKVIYGVVCVGAENEVIGRFVHFGDMPSILTMNSPLIIGSLSIDGV
ncbi:hypothetical protein HK100_001506 [Physocladia obscura]|uniref:Heterokaryon incompatibility domain-containing protein n=1 Tax=Physocladia obscura TaxID=109957 RepID=A0AAD5SYQ7_9FUNG|nr:hypothetical protein HK100_001506 [Physocladia obscura]